MRILRLTGSVLLLLTLFGCEDTPIRQENSSGRREDLSERIQVDFSLNQKTWAKGDLMTITIEIKNLSDEEITFSESDWFFLSDPNGKPAVFNIPLNCLKDKKIPSQIWKGEIPFQIMKGETIEFKCNLEERIADVTTSRVRYVFEELNKGKYRLNCGFGIHEKLNKGNLKKIYSSYEKTFEIELLDGKPVRQ
jgi:hypothetical protein